MFYFDNFFGKKVLKSDYINDITAFFTTREGIDFKNLHAKRLISPCQTHGCNIEIIDKRTEYPDTDGIILTKSGFAAFLRFADCTPLIFYHPQTRIAAISHAGWRSTVQKIAPKTVEKMQLNFNIKPQDMIAIIGPAISICCYETGSDVKEALLSTVKNSSGLFEGNNINLKMINARQLEEAGVQKIDICSYCTSCNNDLFYSYRKENGTKNRHFAIVKLP